MRLGSVGFFFFKTFCLEKISMTCTHGCLQEAHVHISEAITRIQNYQYRIGSHWLPMATNNLLIDYKYTIIALTNFLPIMIGTNW